MRHILVLLLATILPLAGHSTTDAINEVRARLNNVAGLTINDTLPHQATFAAKFDLRITQPLVHERPSEGSFTQRVVLIHRGFDRPTVLVTEGYAATYAYSARYTEELAELFNANIVFVEHRFFEGSTPTPCRWEYLTDHDAMADLHCVVQALRPIYNKGKWISTGVSKGGQTCMEHRVLYPEDVDVSVPYVAPLCYAPRDGRHEPFLRRVGTSEQRQRLYDMQMELLKRKPRLMSAFRTHCMKNGITCRRPLEEIFDFCVLEYPFAMWQWGDTDVPPTNLSDEELLKHLIRKSGPDYFSPEGNPSFFYQAQRELGYYGYDLRPYRKYTTIRSTRNYIRKVMLPDSLSKVKYRKALSREVRSKLKKSDHRIMFLYGEVDPWTSAGVTWLDTKQKQNTKVFIQPGGSHLTRIYNMPADMKRQIVDILSEWMGEKPNEKAVNM